MTKIERKKWIERLKPFWKARNKYYSQFRKQEYQLEQKMNKILGEDLEFFHPEMDMGCCGIGHSDWTRRKRGKNYFPLIHDSELEE